MGPGQPASPNDEDTPTPQDDPYPDWGFNEIDPEIATAPGTIEINGQAFPYNRYGRANPGGEVFIDSSTADDALFHALGISDSNQNVVRLEAPLFGANNDVTFDLSGNGDQDPVPPGSYVVINAVAEDDPRAFQPLCVQAYEGTITEAVSGPEPTVTVTTSALVDQPPAIEDPQLVVWSDTQSEQRVEMAETGDGTFEGTLSGFDPGTYSLHALLRDGTGENAQVVGLSQPTTVEAVPQTGLTFAVDGQSDSVAIDEGETVPYTATATFEDGSEEDVTDQVAVAVAGGDGAAVDIDESVAEVTGTEPGTVTLEADDGQFTDAVEVSVEAIPQASLTFAVDGQSDSVAIDEGETVPYTATATFEDGSQEDVTDQVVVAVAAGDGAAVDIDESAAEITGTEPGTVTLEADDGQFTDTVEMSVEAIPQTGLTFAVDGQSDSVTLAVDEVAPYTATATFEDGSEEDVTDQVAVAVADGDDTAVGIDEGAAEVTGTEPGTATLEADDGQFTDTVAVTVEAGSVGELTFSDQQLDGGTVTVASVTTGQPSTVVVTYSEGEATIAAGLTAADGVDDKAVTVALGDDSGVPGTHTAHVFDNADLPADLGVGGDVSSVESDALDAETAAVAGEGISVTVSDETVPPGSEAGLDIVGSGVETVAVTDLWTDWGVTAADPDGGEVTDTVAQDGTFELAWNEQQASVTPSLAVTPPERYVGGEYKLTATGSGGGDATAAETAVLTIAGDSG